MLTFIVRRLLQAVVVLWAAASLAFVLTFLSGDPATLMIGDHWTAEQIVSFRAYMGFDRPFYIQYLEFMGRLLKGDFGMSVRQQTPVIELILDRFPNTVELALAAMLVVIVVAVPIGIISATKRNSLLDNVVMGGALLAQSMPTFWIGIMLILVFGVYLRWLPISGRQNLSSLILPVITLSAFAVARNARIARASMLETLSQDYIRTARSKGLSEKLIVTRHALKNALIPVVTVLGLEIGALLGGALVTETVFAWPGVGRLTIEAIYARDYPLVQGVITFLVLIFVIINLIVDISYAFLDPRIRLQ